MISREEAIRVLEGLKQTFYDLDIGRTTTSALCMAIEALSQPERPKGRWDKPSLYGLNGKLNDLGVICSHCLKYADTDYDFCPNCGAEMVRGEEE